MFFSKRYSRALLLLWTRASGIYLRLTVVTLGLRQGRGISRPHAPSSHGAVLTHPFIRVKIRSQFRIDNWQSFQGMEGLKQRQGPTFMGNTANRWDTANMSADPGHATTHADTSLRRHGTLNIHTENTTHLFKVLKSFCWKKKPQKNQTCHLPVSSYVRPYSPVFFFVGLKRAQERRTTLRKSPRMKSKATLPWQYETWRILHFKFKRLYITEPSPGRKDVQTTNTWTSLGVKTVSVFTFTCFPKYC